MAVYTEVGEEELSAWLEGYEIGGLRSFEGIEQGVENSNFVLEADRGRFILTLYEKRVEARHLPFFLGLMNHLSGKGIVCPRPVARRDGALFSTLAGRPAAIVSFLEGAWVSRPEASHCRQVGALLAAMHRAGTDFELSRENSLGPPSWRKLFGNCEGRADEVSPGLDSLISDELDRLESDWPPDLPGGVIHADLFCDNVLFRDGNLSGVIDFYFACNDFFAYDLAVCLNAWCFDGAGGFDMSLSRALLEGYESLRPLSEEERFRLPLLASGAALRFLLTRLYDWIHTPKDALVAPKDPLECSAQLEFHRGLRDSESYGFRSVAESPARRAEGIA